MTDVQIGVIW